MHRLSSAAVMSAPNLPRSREAFWQISWVKRGAVARLYAGIRIVEASRQPRLPNVAVGIPQEVGSEKRARVCCPVPVVQGELRVDAPQQRLESVDELAVPRQECWAAVHVSVRVYLVLFEPPTHMARRGVIVRPGVEIGLQLDDGTP